MQFSLHHESQTRVRRSKWSDCIITAYVRICCAF